MAIDYDMYSFGETIPKARAYSALQAKHLNAYGVRWSLHPCKKAHIFYSFRRYESEPKGNGRKALKEVCALADRRGETLVLWTVFPELYGYYESFGFELLPDQNMTDSCRWFKREPR